MKIALAGERIELPAGDQSAKERDFGLLCLRLACTDVLSEADLHDLIAYLLTLR